MNSQEGGSRKTTALLEGATGPVAMSCWKRGFLNIGSIRPSRFRLVLYNTRKQNARMLQHAPTCIYPQLSPCLCADHIQTRLKQKTACNILHPFRGHDNSAVTFLHSVQNPFLTITQGPARIICLRVQVPNNQRLTVNLYYNYYYPKPKYLIIGNLDPLGVPEDLHSEDLNRNSAPPGPLRYGYPQLQLHQPAAVVESRTCVHASIIGLPCPPKLISIPKPQLSLTKA